MLILGGRYGTMEKNTGKSYIHLEYEYAVEADKPLFALVIKKEHLEEKVKSNGSSVLENEQQQKLNEFKELVYSRIVEFWSDNKDIQISIHNKLAEYSQRDDLIGWVQGNQMINGGAIAEEIARLTKENESLRQKAETSTANNSQGNELTLMQTCELLRRESIDPSFIKKEFLNTLNQVSLSVGRIWAQITTENSLLGLLWYMQFNERDLFKVVDSKIVETLVNYGLYIMDVGLAGNIYYQLTNYGKNTIMKMKLLLHNRRLEADLLYPQKYE
jgi:hypothetical protein